LLNRGMPALSNSAAAHLATWPPGANLLAEHGKAAAWLCAQQPPRRPRGGARRARGGGGGAAAAAAGGGGGAAAATVRLRWIGCWMIICAAAADYM
jgi:hypothetical protein